jgi:hypothetical protein
MTITVNKRPVGNRAIVVTLREHSEDIASPEMPSDEDLGETMTLEIESDPTETETLRRARAQVKSGRVYGQEELDKRIADQG